MKRDKIWDRKNSLEYSDPIVFRWYARSHLKLYLPSSNKVILSTDSSVMRTRPYSIFTPFSITRLLKALDLYLLIISTCTCSTQLGR